MYFKVIQSFETFLVMLGHEMRFVLLPQQLPAGQGMAFVEPRSTFRVWCFGTSRARRKRAVIFSPGAHVDV
jgi:hypothetical protein